MHNILKEALKKRKFIEIEREKHKTDQILQSDAEKFADMLADPDVVSVPKNGYSEAFLALLDADNFVVDGLDIHFPKEIVQQPKHSRTEIDDDSREASRQLHIWERWNVKYHAMKDGIPDEDDKRTDVELSLRRIETAIKFLKSISSLV